LDNWIGVDLGQHVDFSAVTVLSRSIAVDPVTGYPARDSRGWAKYDWRLRGLRRFPLKTSYVEVARKVAAIASQARLRPQPRVVVDATGVGVACVETIRTALRPHPEIEVWGVSITSGEGWRIVHRHTMNCSKIQLVGAFREVLETERFKVCRFADGRLIRGVDVLKRELSAFRVRVSRASNEVFGAESGQHDDCVLSVSLPVWAGSLPFMQMRERPDGDADPGFFRREMVAVTAEEAAIAKAEREALSSEQSGQADRNAEDRQRRQRELMRDDDFWYGQEGGGVTFNW
jgi:hypothetical protein